MAFYSISLSGTVLILLALLLRATVLKRAPKRWWTLMWTVISVRMLLPISLPTGDWLANCGAIMRPTVIHFIDPHTLASTGVGMSISEFTFPSIIDLAQTIGDHLFKSMSAEAFLFFLFAWALPAAALGLYYLFSYMRCRRTLSRAVRIEGYFLRSPARGARVDVYSSGAIGTPIAVGVLRPRILLPDNMLPLDEETLNYVLRHELTHIDRFDIVKKNLLLVVACLHWFNPLAWLMLSMGRRDIELACDEQVLGSYDEDVRKSYAMALIALEETRSTGLLPATPFSMNTTEQRIQRVMRYKRPRKLRLGAVLLLLCLLLSAFSTNWTISWAEYYTDEETYMDYGSYALFLKGAENDPAILSDLPE